VRIRRVLGLLALTIAASLAITSVANAGDTVLTERQWRKQANSICARAEEAALAVQDDAFGDLKRDEQPSVEQMTTYVTGVQPIVTGIAEDIAALDEPNKLKVKVKRFVRAMRRELTRLVSDPTLGLEGNPFSDTTLRAEALHLSSCS
jgi:hypothetical protein